MLSLQKELEELQKKFMDDISKNKNNSSKIMEDLKKQYDQKIE